MNKSTATNRFGNGDKVGALEKALVVSNDGV